MKVDKIGQNQYVSPQKVQRNQNQINFKRNGGSVSDMITDSLKAKKVLKKLKDLEWLKGETGGILITAIGTGLVAPFPIAFNPFVKAKEGATKEEKREVQNTKYYTAMRQPISAVLAVLFQLGLLTPIDRGFDALINNEKFSKHFRPSLDHSQYNTKSFVERRVVKNLKESGEKKPTILDAFKVGWKKYRENKENYEQLVKDRVEVARNNQLEKIAENFRETKTILLGSRHLEHSAVAELLNSQIDDYIADAEYLKIKENKLNFYSKRADTLINNEKHLREIFKPENIPGEDKEIKGFLENLLKKEKNPEVQTLIKETLELPEEIQRNHLKRTLDRIDKIKEMCGGSYNTNTYYETMVNRNVKLAEIIERLKTKRITDVASADKNIIEKALNGIVEACSFDKADRSINNILHDTNTFNHNRESLLKKISKDTSKKYKDFLENNYKSFNQPLKVLIGVAITLPITCNALNWVYPRFMDLVFPRLSGAKKDGGDK